ncbi:hypothetical protein ACI2OX_02920 [Bacillus sp. N9]
MLFLGVIPLQKQFDIIVAGHLCLDIIPNLTTNRPEVLFQPGRLVNIGQVLLTTGGLFLIRDCAS